MNNKLVSLSIVQCFKFLPLFYCQYDRFAMWPYDVTDVQDWFMSVIISLLGNILIHKAVSLWRRNGK